MADKHRVTIDLTPSQHAKLEDLAASKGTSKADAVRAGIAFLHWYERALEQGWTIVKKRGGEQTRDAEEHAVEFLWL